MTTSVNDQQAWADAAQWGRDPRMNEVEALMWRSERHPQLSSTVLALLILDTAPDWDRLVAAHEWASTLVPRFRERVLEPALPVGTPAWVPDEHFRLDYHLRRARLSESGGSMADLLAFTTTFGLAPLDRTRPLWEAVLVEGLDGEKAAYVLKLHHSLTDGLGSIQLLALVRSRTPEHTPDKPLPLPNTRAVTTDPVQLAVDELGEQIGRIPEVAQRAWTFGRGVLTDPGRAASAAVRYAASARRVLSTGPAAPSPLLAGRTGRQWHYRVLECGLLELKAAAKAAGGSVNDAFVAALLGGLRRYHDHHGVDIDTLPMGMPVSLRRSDDPMGGNKFAGAVFAAPMGIADPAERIAAVRGAVLSLRTEPALGVAAAMAPLVNRLPSAVGTATWQLGTAPDLAASNIPGVPHPTYLAGARVERMYPLGPLPGVAVAVGMFSHDGTCCLGFNLDGAAVADPDVLMTCFAAGLDEVLELGRGGTTG